jgi:exopolysaccharide biosynthesis protein
MSYRIVPNVAGAVAAIGGGPILVRDGAWYEDPDAPAPDERDYRWPVVALARQADDHLLLVAVDGRHPERSVGMMRPEFADLLIRFGVTDAMALDSGGSVTMVSRAPGDANVTVRNVPSDHSAERWVSDALFVYSSAPQPSLVPLASSATPAPEVRPTP